jgi:hypothetical protein
MFPRFNCRIASRMAAACNRHAANIKQPKGDIATEAEDGQDELILENSN